MGVTLQAIVEVRVQGHPEWSRHLVSWEDVATFEFNKNYELLAALDDVTLRDWPRTRFESGQPLDRWDDPEVTSVRRDVDERDIADNRRWATVEMLREIAVPDEDARRLRFEGMMALCEVLAREYGGEGVRVLFWSC